MNLECGTNNQKLHPTQVQRRRVDYSVRQGERFEANPRDLESHLQLRCTVWIRLATAQYPVDLFMLCFQGRSPTG